MKSFFYFSMGLLLAATLGIVFLFPNQAGSQAATIWYPDGIASDGTGGYATLVDTNWGLLVPGLATSTTGCLSVGAGGYISASGSACGTGSGGGGGSIGTSTTPTAGHLAYWTDIDLLGSVATTSLTASSPLSLSNAISVIGPSASALSIDTSGAWTGTAGSLAANGTNCSAGSFPLGVDEDGAVESCTDAWTEAENTAAGYTSNTGTVTNIATTYPILGGPITTTGTLSLAFGTTTSNTWAGTQTFGNTITTNGTSTTLGAGQINASDSALDIRFQSGGYINLGDPSFVGPYIYIDGSSSFVSGASDLYIQTDVTATPGLTGFIFHNEQTEEILLENLTLRAAINFSPLSASRTFYLPDFTGTFALGNYNTGFLNGSIPYGSSGLLATSSALTFDGTRLNATYASSTAITISGTASTSKFFADGLFTCNNGNMVTWAAGTFGCEVDDSSAGAGSGTVSTSTPLVDTYVTYATGVDTIGAEAAFTYDDALNLLTLSGNASTTQLSATTLYGALVGNASTATLLAANGGNCTAGSFPLGVDDAGAVETCTDAWTEAENTAAAYISDLTSFDTGDLTEGSNLYWTNTRFDARLAATTSLPNITTLANLTITESQISDLDHFTGADITGNETAFDGWDKNASNDYATSNFVTDLAATSSVDSITTLSNLSITESQISDLDHYTNTDAQAFIHGSSTIPKTYTANTFTNTNTFASSQFTLTGLSDGCLEIDTNLITSTGSACGTGSGSGVGTVATSTQETIGQLAAWGTTNGYPARLYSVATTSVSCTGDISCTGFNALGANSTISFTGSYENPLTFNYPLTRSTDTISLAFGTTTANTWSQLQTFSNGINVGGTTFTSLIPTTRQLTVAGTANQITSSAGAQDLSADRTWTLSLPSHVIFPGNFQATNASTTNATTTSFAILNLTAADCDVKALTSGVIYCGTDATGVGGGDFAWTPETNFGTGVNSTSTALWLKDTPFSLFASSTAVFSNASTSQLTIGTDFVTSLTGDALTLTNGTLDVNDVTAAMLASADFGDFSCNGTVCSFDADTIGAAELADEDWGDITISGGVASVENDSHAHTGATISGIDISDDTNLTAGDALTITGDDIDFDGGASPGGSLGGTWASPTIDDLFLLIAGDSSSGDYIWTGSHDFGGATSLEVPNGTAPTANDPGELAHDTSDNQLILDDFVVAKATQKIWSVTVASTSPAFISGGLLPIPTELDGYTMTAIRCKVDTGTSKVIAVEDASANTTEDITCATTVTSDDGSITNAAATAAEEMYIDFGATSGAVDYVTISVFGTWTRE